MDKNELKRLIAGYVSGDLSADDRRLLQEWYDSFGEDENGIPALDDEEIAQRIEAELLQGMRQQLYPEGKLNTRARRAFGWKPWAAAAALVLAFVAVFWQMKERNATQTAKAIAATTIFREVKTGPRQLKQLTLPDSSIVFLNANSIIRIPQSFRGSTRHIMLDEGEAYFEVARDSLRPFVVQMAAGMRIEVLGTAFNVRSYEKLEETSVAVSRGRVRVSHTGHVLGELNAAEGIRYRKADGQVSKTTPDAHSISAWTKGSVRLEEASFTELALTMYNIYGVHLKYVGRLADTYRYNLNISTSDAFDEVLEVICTIHKTTYRRNGNEITIYP
ncbi:FecR family protein [Olivibacter sp. XZL3]|uniref:FecR family protein n=1 Tax=Olivibacter sp. XZL3 TaxID=1735116 RepID=UPI001064D106|nr:FecR family protein [Olivibacter sp. XZL3]